MTDNSSLDPQIPSIVTQLLGAKDPWEWLGKAEDQSIDLLTASFLIAKDEYPDLDLPTCLAQVGQMRRDLARCLKPEADVPEKLRRLNQYVFEELGFSGNQTDYYDPRNSFLNDVLERRLGIPISLSVLYLEFSNTLGLDAQGVAFPGHFLVRVPVEGGIIVLDPFHGSKSVSSQELRLRALAAGGGDDLDDEALLNLLSPASNRSVLLRMLNNLKASFKERNDTLRALRVAHRLVQLHGRSEDKRERGLLYLAIGAGQSALSDLDAYLQELPDASDIGEIREAIIQAYKLPQLC